MASAGTNAVADDFASALDWWREAGVDTLVADEPRDWLAPPTRAAPVVAPSPAAMPETLAAFVAWMAATPDLPGDPAARIAPIGNAASGLMILTDMPDPDDIDAGALFAGAAGRLLDRMLGAIGRDRASAYIAPLLPVRIAGGMDDDQTARIADIARHHVALAAPKRLLLLGQAASRAILGMEMVAARQKLHEVNHAGGTVFAVASFHPRSLLERPAWKAMAWADLRLVLGEGF